MPKYAVAVEDAKYEVEAPDEQTAWNWAVYTHQNQPKAQPPAPFSLADVGLTGAAAVAGAGKSVLQAFGPEALGVETLGGIQKSLLEMRTPERQAEVARRTAIEQQAAKTGTAAEEIGAFLGGIKEAPIQSIAQGIGSTVPALLTGAAALVAGAPLGMTTAVVIGARFLFGALQGAGEVKGTIYDNVYRELRNQGISDVDAKRQAEAAQDYIGNNTDNIFVGAGLGALAGGTGAEKILSNYVAKKMGVDLAAGAAKKEAEGLIMRGVKEALKEGIPEGLQGGQEQFASNVALAREGIETPEFEGVLGSAARDAALGALTGGVVSPFGRQKAAPQAEAPIEKLPEDQLISLRDRYNEAENELQKLADAAKAPDLTPEAKQAAIESFINFKNNIFAPLRLEFSKYRPQIDALTPKTEPTVEPGVEPAPTAKAPEPAAGPLDEAGLRDLNTRFQEAKKQLSLLKNLTRGRDLTPEQRQEAVNAYKDFKVNIFNPIQQEYGKNRQAILALPKVVTLPPTPPAPPAAPPTAAQPPAAPPVAPGATPTDPTIDQPSGEPPRNTSTPSPIVDEPKSTEPPATPVEEPTGLPTPPEKREFQIDTPKEQIAKDVQGMTIPELARWAVINAPNTPARQFALKAFDRINQFADRGIFPGKIKVLNGGIRNESGTRGRVTYRHYRDLKQGFDISLMLNGIPTNGVADFYTGTQYSTILHELLHAATILEVRFNPKSKPVKELENLYARVKAQVKMDIKNGVQHPALEGIKRGANTMQSVDELIAWGLTDKNFQDYLSGIKVGNKTAFTKFVEIMRKLLNINPDFETALDSLMRSTENLLSTPVSEMEKGMGIKLKGAQIMKGKPSAPVELQKTKKAKAPAVQKKESIEEVPITGGTEEGVGTKAVDIINKMGMGVQPPAPSAFQKARQDVKTALENPKLTVESAKKATAGFLDRFETATFSSSSAFDNQLRRAVAADIKENEEVIGMLIDASQSQAVHADALASQFIIEGGIRYDEEYKKWVSYKEPDNFVELGKQINEIAKKYNISEDEARRITHTYFMSKRLRSLQERNENDKARIEELKAERDVAKTKDEKAKINREIERLKDREAFIHLDDPEIELGLSLGEMMPELGKVADTWNGIRRNARRVLVNSGLWTEEYADQMLDVIDYVPFYREVQLEEGQGPREFVRGLQVQAKEHQLKGTNKPVNDILDNMVRWTQYAVNRSVRNDKAVRMIDAALKIEMGDGTKMAERVEKAERGMNVVRIWRDGKQELYNMADPLFADAFTGIQSIAIEPLNWFSKVANTLRDSVVLFPLFSVAQVPQDAFAAMFSSGLQPQYALRIPILAVKEFIKTLSKSSETHQVLKRFGAVGVRDFNSSVIRDDAEVFAGIKAPPGVKGKIKEYLQHIAMSADNSIRQAVYEASVQQGLSKAEALEKAFEIINFRRRGTNKMFQLAGQTIPFFYAYLAAQRVAYNTLSGTGISPQDRKAAWKTLMYTSAAVMTLSMLYAMMAADDEDYKKTPAAIRDRTLTIPGTGGLRIPLRTDFFLFPKIVAEHTYLLMTDKGYEDGAKFRKSMINALGEALFSPTLVPQLAKPAVEALINYDFYQARPILGQYEKQKEWSRQFNESTSEVSKLLGKTGAVSPIMADHLFRGFFGTTGGLFLWFTNTAINKSGLTGVAAPEKTWREAIEAFPGTSGFLSRTNESALRTDFYELRDKVNTAAATFNDIKKNNPQGIKDYLEDEKRMARLVVNKQVENVNQKLAELRARIRQITEAPTTMMTGAEKADAIRQLRQIEDQIYKSINVKGLREKAQM
jgi:hypothetical protein